LFGRLLLQGRRNHEQGALHKENVRLKLKEMREKEIEAAKLEKDLKKAELVRLFFYILS
jgi:hypothetical protein